MSAELVATVNQIQNDFIDANTSIDQVIERLDQGITKLITVHSPSAHATSSWQRAINAKRRAREVQKELMEINMLLDQWKGLLM